ncbi:MAG TPA: hypothetical protein VN577_19870 [Terriglobales bacterium]|nr:hypothetical protein [Terriglobales bacterium]
MDLSRIQQWRYEYLRSRKALAIAAAVFLVLSVVAFYSGYLLIKKTMEDSKVTARAINTPSQLGSLLNDYEPDQIANYIVYLNDVKLEAGPTDNVYYAAGPRGNRLLVVALGSKPALAEDETVDISATIRRVPSTYEMKKKWKLDKAEIKALREQGIYIEAEAIRSTTKKQAEKMAKK